MLTKQQVFDTVVNHLRQQGSKAEFYDEEGDRHCCYRKDGLKCAVGCLIPDEFYNPALEGKTVEHEMVQDVLKDITNELDLLWSLQSIHDWEAVDTWEEQFAEIANYNGLEYKEPSK